MSESPCILGLPEDVIWEILLWSRPDDENMYIWKWLCRVAGTCRLFRRLIRTERPRAVPHSLMPTVFQLMDNYYYFNEAPPRQLHLRGPVAPRVALMETITNSDWMGSGIIVFRTKDGRSMQDASGKFSQDLVEGIKMLLTAPCVPNLQHLALSSHQTHHLIDSRRQHSGLTTLRLLNINVTRVTSNSLAILARSMPRLEKVSIGFTSDLYWSARYPTHLSSFVSHLNGESLTSFSFVGGLRYPLDTVFRCLEYKLPNLKSLSIESWHLTPLQVANIIRSKSYLCHLELRAWRIIRNDEQGQIVITAIINKHLPLETFCAMDCNWINDASIMGLLRGQVATGQVTLTLLGICYTKVTPNGLRTFLMEWRTSSSGRPLTVEIVEDELWEPLVHEFPDVRFKH